MRTIFKVKQGAFDPWYWEVYTSRGLVIIRGTYTKQEAIESAKDYLRKKETK